MLRNGVMAAIAPMLSRRCLEFIALNSQLLCCHDLAGEPAFEPHETYPAHMGSTHK